MIPTSKYPQIVRFFLAATEQAFLRDGQEVGLGDMARAAVLVAPGRCPVQARVVELPPRRITGRIGWAEDTRRIIAWEWAAGHLTPEAVLDQMINWIPDSHFDFTEVATTGWWRRVTMRRGTVEPQIGILRAGPDNSGPGQ